MAVVNGGDSQLNAGNTVNVSSGDSSLQGVRVSDGWKNDVQRYRQSQYSSPSSYGDGYDDYANSYRSATITQDDEVDPDDWLRRYLHCYYSCCHSVPSRLIVIIMARSRRLRIRMLSNRL